MNSKYEFQLCALVELHIANNKDDIKQFIENENIDFSKLKEYQASTEHHATLRMQKGLIVSKETLRLEEIVLNKSK